MKRQRRTIRDTTDDGRILNMVAKLPRETINWPTIVGGNENLLNLNVINKVSRGALSERSPKPMIASRKAGAR